MADNTSRSLFSLHGITGMLVATLLLIGILVFLTAWSINVQQSEAAKYYDPTPITGSLDNVKMISKENANFAFKDAQ
ncbi:MAG TPA: hypothetical protein CFH81_05900 [Sulfurovum sp. UBA12169]|jgi:hypothetical protein|nr:MAG TPA: hypothetical protein CFH81_05900 [Sulfurovum sp. UBA12169]